MICPPLSRCESLNAKRHIICTCFLSFQMVLTVVKIRMKTDCAVFHLSLCVCSAEKLLSLWFLGILTVTQSLIFHLAFSWIEFEWCCNMFLYCIHSSKGKKHHVPLERGWLKFLRLDYTHISVWMLVLQHYIFPLVLIILSLWPVTQALQSCCVFMYIVFVVILLVLFILFNW